MAEMSAGRPNGQLRHQRHLRGWTLNQVADGLHRLHAQHGDSQELGVDAHMVGRWERGVRRATPRYVELLCRLFQLPAPELGLVEETAQFQPMVACELKAWSSTPRLSMTVAGCTNQCWVEP